MDETPWVYRRDEFDLILGRAAKLLVYVDLVETILLPEGYCDGRPVQASPEHFIWLGGQRVVDVLGILHCEAYCDGESRHPGLPKLLARIGTPDLSFSVDSSGKWEMEHWPKPDRKATRTDLLYAYLLAKLLYVELKARLQARSVTIEELASFTEAASALVVFPNVPALSVDDTKQQLLSGWQQCPWHKG
jgi:hypothetical protein